MNVTQWLDDRRADAPGLALGASVASVRDRVVLAIHIVALLGASSVCVMSAFGVRGMPSPLPLGLCILASSVLVYAIAKQIPGARTLTAWFWAFALGFLLEDRAIHDHVTAAVFLPPVMALSLSGPRTVIVAAVVPLLVAALRGGADSPYLQPGFLIVAIIIDVSLVASHYVLGQALGSAAQQMRRLRAITSETNDAVVVRAVSSSGGFGDILFVSPSIERVLGYSPHEYRSIDLRGLIHEGDLKELDRVEDLVRSQPGQTISMELRAKHKLGHFSWIESRATNLVAHPDVRGFVLIFHDITATRRDRERFEQELERQATHDSLTGLPNRRQLLDALTLAINDARATNEPLSIVFCDLDHFKVVNDSLGHDVGDVLLQLIAETIAGVLGPSDSVARFGGDEFVVICKKQSSEYASELAYRLLEAIAKSSLDPRLDSRALHVTMSMGVAELKDHDRPEDLLRDADVAMYTAKDAGRARAAAFTSAMRTRAFRRHELEQALWRALEDHEFELAYQPKIELATKKVLGFEALLRWRIAGTVSIGPADFIPVAEDTGAIVPIGRWVLDQACERIKRWQRHMPGITLAVNLSGRQLHHQGIVEEVQHALVTHGVKAESLELEMTESVVMTNAEAAISRLLELKKLGVTLAIDDFGTGYSSLSYLRKLPVDVLKIDRAFVAGLGQDKEDTEIVRLIVAMARALRLVTVAEGVESQEQIAELSALGCCVGQGFFLSRPMSENDVESWLKNQERRLFA
jgi:diguanylate cyclase (GGDEF)-like protein/PAS domain S-box-containing protein